MATLPQVKLVLNRAQDQPAGESVTMLCYGPSGSGKTAFAGTAGNRDIIFDCGDGTETLRSPWFKSKYPDRNPYVMKVNEGLDVYGMPDKAVAFDTLCALIDEALKNPEIDTIIVDEVSEFRGYSLNKGMEINAGEGTSKSFGKSKLHNIAMPVVQDRGREMEIVKWFIATYTALAKKAGKHFVMLALERITTAKPKDAGGRPIIGEAPVEVEVRPGFTGEKFPDEVPALFDEVWHMEVVGSGTSSVYRARTVGDEKLIAKSRHGGVFGTVELNPDFLSMVERIKSARPLVVKK